MPRTTVEPARKAALLEATIAEIGAAGNLDVTVGQIAKRAGMSSALAFHYFGAKETILAEAMRHILRDFGREVRAGLAKADKSDLSGPCARARAIISASFSPACFDSETISGWMALYAQAPTQPAMRRMLAIYQRRLHSNLAHALAGVSPAPAQDAARLAALIDGLYLRAAVGDLLTAEAAKEIALSTLDLLLERRR